MHTARVLTLVVSCGFTKPLPVDPLTISLVDSPFAESVRSRDVRLPSSDVTEASLYCSRKQASSGNQSHMDKLQSKKEKEKVLKQVRRLNSSQPAQQYGPHTPHTPHIPHLPPEKKKKLRLVAQLPPQKPNENTPLTPSTRSDQPTDERGNHQTHTRPSCTVFGLSLQQPFQNTQMQNAL